MENFIQLKKSNVLRFGIKTSEGIDTGEYIEFDIEDIELPLKIQESEKQHKNNILFIKSKFLTIEKQQDRKGKKLLSKNDEEKVKALKEFYEKEEKALDLILGENGTKKMLNGRKPYYSMFEDITEALEPILPKIQAKSGEIVDKIKAKYKTEQMDVME